MAGGSVIVSSIANSRGKGAGGVDNIQLMDVDGSEPFLLTGLGGDDSKDLGEELERGVGINVGGWQVH